MHCYNVLHNTKTQPLWDSYLDALNPYFKICEGNSVLEIAPFNGTHTGLIKSYNPKSVTLVELSKSAVNVLRAKYPYDEVVHDDIFFYLNTTKQFDVVVCAGLLYHLHSPIYLLELIVNRCSPKYMIIESFGSSGTCPVEIVDEITNLPGNHRVHSGWKTAGLKLDVSPEIIIKAINNLGYKLTNVDFSVAKPTGNAYFCVFEKV